jgi:hypothetical protein
MKHFIERVFYLEKRDTCVSVSFYAFGHGIWVFNALMTSGHWYTTESFSTYEEAFDSIRHQQPILLCEELL